MTSHPRRWLYFLLCRWRQNKRVEVSRSTDVAEPITKHCRGWQDHQKRSVPTEQGQPLRAVESDEWAMKVRAKPIPETPTQRQRDTHELTHLPPVSLVSSMCVWKRPLMILIGDGKTQEILDWTLFNLITLTFQLRSECLTRS